MRRKFYVYVNWKTRDVVSTSSNPGMFYTGVLGQTLAGRKAIKLFLAGYDYFGYFRGWDVTNLIKK